MILSKKIPVINFHNILNTELKTWPWYHGLYTSVLHDEWYDYLIKNLPEEKYLSSIRKVHGVKSDLSQKRYTLQNYDLLPENTKGIWKNISEEFLNGKLKKLMITKLKKHIIERFGQNNLIKYEYTDTFQLTLDKPGYYLNPHTDAQDKLFTIIINLAENNQTPDMGTLIIEGPNVILTKKNKEKRKFYLAKKTEYLPNTGVGVFKTDYSWHAVNKTKHDRWTIQYTIWAKPKNDT